MRSWILRLIFGLILISIVRSPAPANVRPAAVFGDNMVFQQNMELPVWGIAEPGEKVAVTFAGQAVEGVADAKGKWQVRLKPVKANETPAELRIVGTNSILFKNVLVGEVWLCSGQSNMEWTLARAQNGDQEIAAANDSQIRLFSGGASIEIAPREMGGGAWAVCSPKSAAPFSAVGYLYARELRQALHVPVGMINESVGGTRAEPWTPLETFKKLPAFAQRAAQYEKDLLLWQTDKAAYLKQKEQEQARYPAVRSAWYQDLDSRDPGLLQKWMSPQTDVTAWRGVPLPGKYGNNPLGSYLGSLWCRKVVSIPPAWVGKDLELHLGPIDEADDSYVNGEHVGRTWFEAPDFWKVPRVYAVPGSAVRSPEINVTVRVLNLFGDVGFFGSPDEMKIVLKGDAGAQPVSLAGGWRYTEGLFLTGGDIPHPPSLAPNGPSDPAGIYNGTIHPLIPFGIRGAIWYQGESNAEDAAEYSELFRGLISSWRQAWGQGDFPFAFVQLPNYLTPQRLVVEKGSWAELREAQAQALALPNTTMAVTIDAGDALSIHPLDKKTVARRLALGVLANTYHQPGTAWSGPVFQSMQAEKNMIRLKFDFATGLHFSGDPAASFAIAGSDKVFHPAHVRIVGNTLEVSSDEVQQPAAVRYGWVMNPTCVLYNADQLPCAPFRTDSWNPRDVHIAP